MADLRGKSARTVEIYVQNRSIIFGMMNREEVTLAVFANPAGTGSNYAWGGAVSGNAATAVYVGPDYDPNGFTEQASATATVSVVFDGVTYTASLVFTYTAAKELG